MIKSHMEFPLTLIEVPASRERMVVPPDEPSIWTTKSRGSLQARQVTLVTDSSTNVPSECLFFYLPATHFGESWACQRPSFKPSLWFKLSTVNLSDILIFQTCAFSPGANHATKSICHLFFLNCDLEISMFRSIFHDWACSGMCPSLNSFHTSMCRLSE